MSASNKTQDQSPWWAGIARFVDSSDTFIGKVFQKMFQNWQRNLMLADENPQLAYQQPIKSQPQPFPQLQYRIPQAEPQPYLKQKQSFEDYFYHPSQGIEQPDLTRINGVKNTLYQTTYKTKKYSLYQVSKPSKAQKMFGYGNNNQRSQAPSNAEGTSANSSAHGGVISDSTQYEQPKTRTKALAYSQPIETVLYEPKHNHN